MSRQEYYHDTNRPAANSIAPAAFAAVRDAGGRILLVRRIDSGNWELPGGRIEVGESATTAAEREVVEESGIKIRVTRLAGLYSDPAHVMVYPATGEARQQFAVCLHALPVDGEPHPDNHETSDAAWVDPTHLEQLPIHPSMRQRIIDALTEPDTPAPGLMSRPGRSGWPFRAVGLYRETDKGAVAVMGKSIHSTPVTVVGIPVRNEADTIAAVAHAADLGLRLACPGGDNLIVLADNGSTDGTPDRFLAAATSTPRQVVSSPAANTGKGTNVLALVHKALEVRAERLILLDADLRSAQPEWIGQLAAAVSGPAPNLAVPVYRRNRYEANTTNHLARPLVAGLFGRHLAQPIGGEFALNRALLERVVEWPVPGSALFYGIDIWLTTNSVREGYQVAEVSLGRKLHNSPFPKILHLPQQVLDSLFHVAVRAGQPDPAALDTAAAQHAVDVEAVPQDPALIGRVGVTARGYLDAHQPLIRRMFPTVAGLPSAPWGVRISTQDWPVLLANSIQALAGGQFQAARDHLVALYINRVLSFFEEIEQLSHSETNALLDRQTRDTAKAISERSVTFAAGTAPQTFDRGYWTGIG